ncbi:hypothetical protein RND81_03G082000 [Saponaria officinalis]|uniref:WD repeat-containing protein 76 n=1 Tax=Saponaria officinalis TaxID=3572 RepID=A0AAW1M233_SAPOF
MASGEKMTAYERQRLENIRRNTQMMASLYVHDRPSDLATSSKRLREEKSYKQSSEKMKKSEEPVVIRRSLRSQGIPPDSKGLPMDSNESLVNPSKKTIKLSYAVTGPVSMKDAYCLEEGSYRAIIDKFTNITNSQSDDVGKSKTKSVTNGVPKPFSKVERVNLDEPLDVNSLNLDSENIARVVPGRIYCVRFIPTTDMTMVVAGSKYGHLGFWDVKPEKEDEDVIHLYQPHASPISGIYVHPFSSSKVYTSSYDGFVRFMDIEREEFNLVYSSSSESKLYSLSLQPNDADSVYIGDGRGYLNVVDGRVGELTNSWSLHDWRINTIDFNPANPNIMVTSSSDGLACLWDLRKMDVKHSEPISLQSFVHKRAVHSAYFSPSGSSVATTSVDANIGVICGVNFEDKFMIPHAIWTNQWVSTFRASWGWDDTHLFIGNMKRKVDVVSVNQRKAVHTLESPLMTAIPCRYDAHPYTVGLLAGATSGGQIYIWTAS